MGRDGRGCETECFGVEGMGGGEGVGRDGEVDVGKAGYHFGWCGWEGVTEWYEVE